MKPKKKLPPGPRSSKHRLWVDDLAPDGIRFTVDWSKLVVGASLFVPAVNVWEAIAQIYAIAKHYGWTIEHSYSIENGRQGVRFWRIL